MSSDALVSGPDVIGGRRDPAGECVVAGTAAQRGAGGQAGRLSPDPVSHNPLAQNPLALAGGSAGPDQSRLLVTFTGSGWELLKIHLVNALLTSLTLGVYSFWGKVKVRRYLWENTAVLGDSLEYTGTGGELFRSFLVVMALSAVGMGIYYALSMVFPMASLFLSLLLIPVTHFASYQALRYRLTRTRWKGIRGNMDGSAKAYAVKGTGYSLLTMLTAFVCAPLETARLTAMRLNAAFFGDRRFSFSGKARPLFGPWLTSYVPILLLLSGLGILLYSLESGDLIWLYVDGVDLRLLVFMVFFGGLFVVAALIGLFTLVYNAAVVRWLFAGLSYGEMRFDAHRYTAWGLFKLTVGNGLLLLFTLGLAFPWTTIRSLRFLFSSVRYEGDPRLEALSQDTLPERSGGEGLLDALDVDLAM